MNKNITLQDQLKNKANFMDGDRLFLVRCIACPDCGDRGKENYMLAVASGICSWCGWESNETNK